MKANHLILSAAAWLMMATAAWFGWQVGVEPAELETYRRHFILGVGAILFTCLVHVVLFMYFAVQWKIVTQAILHHGLAPAISLRLQPLKSRALRLSMGGIATVLLAGSLGAAAGATVSPHWHTAAALTALAINAWVFFQQAHLIELYYLLYDDAFGPEDRLSTATASARANTPSTETYQSPIPGADH